VQLLLDIIHQMGIGDFWQLVLENGALLLLPALGGVISERTGVVNIAMEGMMLAGAFVAVVSDLALHNPWLAALAAMLAGAVMAAIHAVLSIRFHADQIISGIAINIFAAGFTGFLVFQVFSDAGGTPQIANDARLPLVNVPVLSDIPFVGVILFHQSILVYVSLVLLVAINFVLFRTRLGLRLRAVGEHPQAADTAGINVYVLRYGAVLTSGLLSGLAGAFLSIGLVNVFNPGMTEGRGYIALAAMIFGKWKPVGAFVACLIFGFGYAIFARSGSVNFPSSILQMAPYLLTLVVLAGLVGKSTPPAADGIPYEPGAE
jgi:general nucleoside transport system permease protein